VVSSRVVTSRSDNSTGVVVIRVPEGWNTHFANCNKLDEANIC
jgi:hypothetical protein